MKKLLICLLLSSPYIFATEVYLIKIDRQYWGDNSFGHLEGPSYRFLCSGGDTPSRIISSATQITNTIARKEFIVDHEECYRALGIAEVNVRQYRQTQFVLTCETEDSKNYCAIKF